MYIQLTNEKEQPITIMVSAILYFLDTVNTNPDIKARIFLNGHAINVQETSADIRAFIDDLDT